MYRIHHQHEEHRQLAMRALSWISKAERPLQVEELQHAIAVEFGDEDVEDGPLESATLIVSVCAGLVTIDAESRTFRLVHFSVQELFEKKHYKWFPDADRVIAETCLTYLSFDTFEQGIVQKHQPVHQLSRKYPLFLYAAENWGCHVNRSRLGLEEFQDVALKFLGNERKVAAVMRAMYEMRYNDFKLFRYAHRERVPGIHLVVVVQCLEFAAAWKSCGNIDTKDPRDGYTALQLSIELNDLEMTRCLLDAGADVNESSDDGCTALMKAADLALCEIVKLLLERGADPNARGKRHFSCLHYAAFGPDAKYSGSEACCGCIGLLLKAGADIEARDDVGNTPLTAALRASNFSIGECLLQRGASADVANSVGRTPLSYTLNEDNKVLPVTMIKMVELLLRSGADVNVADRWGCTPLMEAVRNKWYGCRATELLLQFGADVNAIDEKGETAVTKAVREYFGVSNIGLRYRYMDLWVVMKLKTNANSDNVDKEVLRLFRKRCQDILSALLSRGVNEQTRNNTLDLALSYPDPDEEIVKMLLAEKSGGACEVKVPIRQHASDAM